MLTAYLDVSRGNEPVYVLGGFIGNVGQWDKFRIAATGEVPGNFA
jgi:hypothetical protein